MKDTKTNYGSVSRFLHWLLAILIIVQFSLVVAFTWIAPEHQGSGLLETTMMLHKSTGLLVLLFGLIFILWRITQAKPSLEAIPAWQRGLARLVHIVLYAIIAAQPVFGILMVTSSGQPVPFFGLFSVPPFVSLGEQAGSIFGSLHAFTGWWIILIALGLHIAGSLYHHFVRKDDVLRRMWRGRPDN